MPYDELEDLNDTDLQDQIRADAQDEIEAEQEELDMWARTHGYEDWADYQAYLKDIQLQEPVSTI